MEGGGPGQPEEKEVHEVEKIMDHDDSDDEMYESWRRDHTHNDDEVYELQDTFEDHWTSDEIIEILEMQDRGYSRAEAIEIVLHM